MAEAKSKMTRFAPFFAAGFLTASIATSGISSIATFFGIGGAALLSAPISGVAVGLLGGAAAAVAYGRSHLAV